MSMKLKDIPFETLMPTIVPTDKVPASDEVLASGEDLVAVVGARSIQMLNSSGDYCSVVTAGYCDNDDIWFFNGVIGYAECAEHACGADYACSAGYACIADYAERACYADCAGYACGADCAGQASYACWADCAGQASYACLADCAGQASYADQALCASTAYSACYADCAGYADRIGCTESACTATAIFAACDGLYFEFNALGDGGSTQAASKRLEYGDAGSLPSGAKVLYFV